MPNIILPSWHASDWFRLGKYSAVHLLFWNTNPGLQTSHSPISETEEATISIPIDKWQK